MKKSIEWLKEEIGDLPITDTVFISDGLSYIDSAVSVTSVYDLIYHLEEPEVLSEEWIDENKFEVNGWNEAVHVEDLQNLLVPKQEITFDQVHDKLREESILSEKSFDYYWNCINDNVEIDEPGNSIVPKQEEITEEQAWGVIHGKYGNETLQNNIDYVESQGYVVIEKPIIPQFVADWHKQNKYYLLSAKFERIADWEDERVVNWYEKYTGRHSNNLANAQETIALMDLVGYEVEKEKLYIVQLPTNLEDDLIILDADGDIWKDSWPSRYKMTEKRIKEIDERYWPFAKEVAE